MNEQTNGNIEDHLDLGDTSDAHGVPAISVLPLETDTIHTSSPEKHDYRKNAKTVKWSRPMVSERSSENHINLMGAAVGAVRIVVIITTVVLLLVATCLCLAAILTPAWLTVYLAEFHSEHHHGLWLDCTMDRWAYDDPRTRNYVCTYKFEDPVDFRDLQNQDVHSEEIYHQFYNWQAAVLALLLAAVASGGVALCFTFCASCVKICAIVANVFEFISFLASIVGLIIFFFNSHRNDIRFVTGVRMTYEQHRGYSFYLALASMVIYLIVFLIGILATIFIFVHDKQQHRPRRTFPERSNGNANTSVTTISANVPMQAPTSISV